MLVMSRRQDEKIVFPGLGITVTLLNIRGNSARLGIDAPREITVLRQEIADSEPKRQSDVGDQHGIRNILNSVNLFVMLYQRQMESGLVDEAASTFMKMVDFLERQTCNGQVSFQVEAEPTASEPARVMIVEDDEEQRGLMTSLLSTYGLNVVSCENGRAALSELRRGEAPEVVVLDWAMPEFGGAWLIPKIRNTFGTNSPKLFVVSGADRQPKDVTVDAWLAKPLNHQALLARIRAAVAVA